MQAPLLRFVPLRAQGMSCRIQIGCDSRIAAALGSCAMRVCLCRGGGGGVTCMISFKAVRALCGAKSIIIRTYIYPLAQSTYIHPLAQRTYIHPLAHIFGTYIWHIYSHTFGTYIWHIYLAHIFGTYIIHTHLAHIYMAHIFGIYIHPLAQSSIICLPNKPTAASYAFQATTLLLKSSHNVEEAKYI